jgi:hypothetical protein
MISMSNFNYSKPVPRKPEQPFRDGEATLGSLNNLVFNNPFTSDVMIGESSLTGVLPLLRQKF